MTGLRARIFAYALLLSASVMAPLMFVFFPTYSEPGGHYDSMSSGPQRQGLSSEAAELESIQGMLVRFGGIFAGSFVIMLLSVAYTVNRLVVNPVKKLNLVVTQLAQGKYDVRIPEGGRDELGGLTGAIELLQSNIRSTMERYELESASLNDVLIELHSSEVRSKGIFNSVQDGIIITDRLGVMVSVNPALCELTGYRKDELLENNVDILLPKSYRLSHQKKIVDFALDYNSRPNRNHMQLEVHCKEGNDKQVEISLSQFKTSDEHYIIAVVSDISERVKAEQALRYERDRAQSYLDTAEVALVSIDRNGLITLVNRKCCELLDFNEAELLGQDYFNLCPEQEEADEIRDAYIKHVMNNDIFPKYFYINLNTKDGQKRIFEWHNNTIKDYESNTAGIILAGTDMTEFRKSIDERKKLRDKLHHAKKMEAIGRLSSGIAHDFNNILASIMGYTELLQDIMAEDGDATINDYLKEIYASGERARDLIDNMLKYSRGVAKEDKTTVETLYIPGIAGEVMSMLRGVIPAGINITTNIRQDTSSVEIDSFNLQQIIMNLCLNACDAMHQKGDLSISASDSHGYRGSCTACSRAFEGDFVELSFADTGAGIEPEVITHLFEPFFTTKLVGEVGKGAGMGLAVVHGVVHDAGGHIVVESRPGIGSTFRVFLPIATCQPVAMEA